MIAGNVAEKAREDFKEEDEESIQTLVENVKNPGWREKKNEVFVRGKKGICAPVSKIRFPSIIQPGNLTIYVVFFRRCPVQTSDCITCFYSVRPIYT